MDRRGQSCPPPSTAPTRSTASYPDIARQPPLTPDTTPPVSDPRRSPWTNPAAACAANATTLTKVIHLPTPSNRPPLSPAPTLPSSPRNTSAANAPSNAAPAETNSNSGNQHHG